MGDSIGVEASVVKDGLDAAFLVDLEKQRVAVFRYQLGPVRPVPGWRGPDHVVRGRQEDVDGIVDNDGRVHCINSLKMSDVWDWTCKTWRGGSTSSLHRIETDSVRQTQCASQPPFRAQALKAQLISALLQLLVGEDYRWPSL